MKQDYLDFQGLDLCYYKNEYFGYLNVVTPSIQFLVSFFLTS